MANSQLQQLKSALNTFAQATDRMAQSVSAQKRDFDKSSQQLLALMGGSATGKDRQVVQAIEQAKKAVDQASAALNNGSRTAKDYSGTI